MRSGSFHSNSPLALPSMLRHSKRCFTQWKPPSRASCRSRAVVPELPHRNTWTAGSVDGTCALTRATGDADADGDGTADEGEGKGDAEGDTDGELTLEGFAVVAGFAGAAARVGVGTGGVLVHATTVNKHRLRQRYRRSPMLKARARKRLTIPGTPQIEPLIRAVRTALSAARGVPSGLSTAHQYSSSLAVHLGSDSVQSVMTPIHGAQCCRAYWYAWTMLAAF